MQKGLQTNFSDDGKASKPKIDGVYEWDELVSALQKDIRRGNEYEAVFWATKIETANPKGLWNRLRVIASEDVGLANSNATILVDVLEKQYRTFREAEEREKTEKGRYRLFLVHAVLFLARSPKSRMVDNLLITVYDDKRKLEIPNYAKDMHTLSGIKMGRGYKHFFEEGAKITNKTIEDIYEDKAEEIKMKKGKT
jgi:replication-associated recombination protein RarA